MKRRAPRFTVLLLVSLVAIGFILWLAVQLPVRATPALQSPEPFLSSPYYGSVQLNSYFDHQYPTRHDPPNEGNPTPTPTAYPDVMIYTGDSRPSCDWVGQSGTYCYDGHYGIDFNVRWDPVLASAAGQVEYSDWSYPRDHGRGYGLVVYLGHGNDYQTRYGHLTAITVGQVDPGQQVARGEQIGTGGNTGGSEGAHLHFEVRHNGRVVDPYGWEGTDPDPWAEYSQGATSAFLWAYGEQVGSPIPESATDFEIVVDDDWNNDAGDGFHRGCNAGEGDQCPYWDRATDDGHDGDLLHTLTVDDPDYWVEWHPDLPQAGVYEILAHIPTPAYAAANPQYTIHHNGEQNIVFLDQPSVNGKWISLGAYPFAAGTDGYVRVTDATGEDLVRLAVDALKFVHRVSQNVHLPLVIRNYPEDPSTPIPTPTSTPTPAPSCVEGENLLVNGGFEEGEDDNKDRSAPPWIQRPENSLVRDQNPSSGDWGVWLGGYNNADEEIYQTVFLPSDMISATCTFSMYIYTEETSTMRDWDWFYLDLKDDATGWSILTHPITATNRYEHQNMWVSREINITGLDQWNVDQAIRVSFAATTDGSLFTSFFVDTVKFITHCP